MSTTTRVIEASPSDVFAVLADGWLYASWVVGASRIREVDAAWPSVGSNIHHSVGAWPLLIDDRTEVKELEPDRRLKLLARAWPTGEAMVEITAEPHPEGSLVTIVEDAVKGPGLLVPQPVRSVGLDLRNRETLQRLAFLCERRDHS